MAANSAARRKKVYNLSSAANATLGRVSLHASSPDIVVKIPFSGTIPRLKEAITGSYYYRDEASSLDQQLSWLGRRLTVRDSLEGSAVAPTARGFNITNELLVNTAGGSDYAACATAPALH